jgi:glycosyltransferase involved in cell wall biosynthesis
MQFSVLMSVYTKDDPNALNEALNSVTINQTLPPKEVIIVKDGPLNEALDAVLEKFKNSGFPCKIISLMTNRGLAIALNEGLKHCRYEWVARMDSDDIALPDRFEKQCAFLQKYDVDVLGGWIEEYDHQTGSTIWIRKVPLSHQEILRFMRRRSPFNHVTVMYKKESILRVGGYEPGMMEDFVLWLKLARAHAVFANIDNILVKVRSGEDMLVRRRGMRYAKEEWILAYTAYQMHVWPLSLALTNAVSRSMLRLLPKRLIKKVYNRLRKK